jgi:hypothetical protein
VTLTHHPLLVPWSIKSRAIPLLPLWAVRPVQYSYTSTPPMGRSACTEPRCLYSTAIPLLPLWAVRPVQSLSACTVQLYLYSPYGPYSLYKASVPVQYSYTSTPPMDHTARTEPHCLYKGALYLSFYFKVGHCLFPLLQNRRSPFRLQVSCVGQNASLNIVQIPFMRC